MQPQQGGGLYSPESASRRKSASSEQVLVQSLPSLLQLASEKAYHMRRSRQAFAVALSYCRSLSTYAAVLVTLHDPTSLQLLMAWHILSLRHTHAAVLPSGSCHKHFSFSICLILFRQQQSKHSQQPSAQPA